MAFLPSPTIPTTAALFTSHKKESLSIDLEVFIPLNKCFLWGWGGEKLRAANNSSLFMLHSVSRTGLLHCSKVKSKAWDLLSIRRSPFTLVFQTKDPFGSTGDARIQPKDSFRTLEILFLLIARSKTN